MHKRKYIRGFVIVLVFGMGLGVWTPPCGQDAAYASQNDAARVELVIDGTPLRTTEQAILTQGRTLVPLRILMETLGAQVQWNQDTRSVTVTKDAGSSVQLWIDNRLICYTEAGVVSYDVCDIPPQIIADRTYIPLRLVAGALNLSVVWDDQRGQVHVDTAKGGEKTRFFDVSIAGLQTGQVITGGTQLSVLYGSGTPAGAAQVRYLFLDPDTGDGKIVASGTASNGSVLLTPDPASNGIGVLAAVVCDSAGNFLAGAAMQTVIQLTPAVSVQGLTEGQKITGETRIGSSVNFQARGVEYEFTILASGESTRSAQADPMEMYLYNPPAGLSGPVAVRVIAYDASGNAYTSQAVTVQADTPPPDASPQVNLKSFAADNVGKIPVTLSISRNFDAVDTQYWARNTLTGESVLLADKPWGDHAWFPGPDMAGTWEVYVMVKAPNGAVYTSNSRKATVSSSPSLILSGIGPGQVVTGKTAMHSTANVALQQVEYILNNPFNGSQKSLGIAQDTNTEITWTPESVNEGERYIQAVGTIADGQKILSEKVSVKVYLGQFYTARPIVEKEKFIEYVTPMALATQRQNGMSAALQIAQAILETGWGQSVPVDRYTGLLSYNLFGIKGKGTAGSVLSGTSEEYYGTLYRVDADFRAYHSVRESWDDHNDLLLRLERYKPYRDVMYHNVSGAYALKRCGYATDSAYPEKLITIINQYGLDKLDRQKL